MWRWVRCAAVLVLPGCFHPNYDHPACGSAGACPGGLTCDPVSRSCVLNGSTGTGSGTDAGTPGNPDGGSTGQTDCFQRWFDGAPGLALSQPTELTALASAGDDRDPWVSADGLRMFFDRNPGQQGGTDIYLATRSSTTADFSLASAVVNLDTVQDEARAALSGDEKLLVFTGDHNTTSNHFQLFVSRRSDPAQPFPSPFSGDQALVASVNTPNDDYFDPFLSQDGLRLYVSPALAGSPQQIRVATRTATDQNFGSSVAVEGINSGETDADPALSPDERIMVFSSTRPAGAGLSATNLWYATRPAATAAFTSPKLIPTVNSDQADGDPMLSADGCELYFASKRVDSKYHLFRARVMN